ncbi:MAG: HAMP domain-containing histidine kinase [Chloroflexi bacterium]|nr:HAMP domain-containing histidine kinase [Chloroflexota bacterium]
MGNTPQPTLSLTQALAAIADLQEALPPPMAEQLANVSAVLQSLSAENAYLNTLLLEDKPLPRPAAPEPPPAARPPVKTLTGLLRESAADPNAPLTELFAGVNDALRPPLIAIRGRADLVRAGLLGQITSEQDLWLQAIEENTSRAFAVLDALQELIALQRGQVRMEMMNFISTDLLKEAWERIRDKVRPYGHEVTLVAPEVVPLAQGDFYHALMVMTDLLDNAIRYTPPNGQIRMSVDNLGTHVLFSVTDNGVGLTADDLKNVGRPFWRGDHNRLVRQHPGTGLRLYIAKQLLALQGGELIFSGEPGLGSTFSFALRTPD